ncbi:MAG: penicillin-binding protein 1A [Gammaproteobacteria bacterium]|nr:MAG: penicillin-binding protein 1A [Gammaproteobacteria bacterium]
MDHTESHFSHFFRQNFPDKPWQIALLAVLGLGITGIAMLALITLVLTPSLPEIDNITEDRLKVPMRVYTADAVLIGEFGEERRIPKKIEEIPKALIQAILSTEDAGFYEHHGVHFLGILRAAWINFRSGTHRQGASTITMQVARNYFLSPKKTYTRKLKEVLLAFKLERELTKDEILELYINKIFLGHRAYGFAAASRIYYGKPLKELTLPEIAMLAGLPKAPSRNNPLNRAEAARDRRNYVLNRMFKLGNLDEAIYRQVITAPLTARKHALRYDIEAPYIAEMVRQYMFATYKNQTYAGGFHVYTTLQSRHQKAANAALRKGLLAYERRHGYYGPAGHITVEADVDKEALDQSLKDYRAIGNLLPGVVLLVDEKNVTVYTQDGYVAEIGWSGLSWARRYINANALGPNIKTATEILEVGDVIYLENVDEGRWRLAQVPRAASAVVALRPNDGAILALTGGFDFRASKFNRVIQAKRQPGSNLKPFIYSAALSKGFTAATTVSGAPITIEDETLEDVWRPENYSGKFFGPTRLRKALTLSLNLVSIRLLRAMGPGYAIQYLERFGFDSKQLPRNLSLALGSASVTPLTMVNAFAVFANGGFRVEPYFIVRVEDSQGNILEQANPYIVCKACEETLLTEAQKKEREQEQGGVKQKAPGPGPNKNPGNASDPGKDDTGEALKPRLAPRTITPENAFLITSIMRDVIQRGTARRALILERQDLAGKTGTTNEFRDAWFSGFNDQIVATAWLGFDQPETLGRGEAGSRAALPIWIDFMREALTELPENPLVMPRTIETRLINSDTGLPATENDPDAIEEFFDTTQDVQLQSAAGDAPGSAPLNPETIGSETAPETEPSPAADPQNLPEGLF